MITELLAIWGILFLFSGILNLLIAKNPDTQLGVGVRFLFHRSKIFFAVVAEGARIIIQHFHCVTAVFCLELLEFW